jgi:VWFA-related protein
MNGSLIRRSVPVLMFAFMQCARGAAQQANDQSIAENQTRPRVKVTSSLVVLRVVVRDAQGKPVQGLQKEDFKLFDQGKEQPITQFEAGSYVVPNTPAPAAPVASSEAQPSSPSPAAAGRFLALYFDDLNTTEVELSYAREAAGRYVSDNLQANDRVAVFTSGKMLTNFTSNHRQIQEALAQLNVNTRALNSGDMNCPNLSDYQALQIVQNPNNQGIDAWKVAVDELQHCGGGASAPVSSVERGSTRQPSGSSSVGQSNQQFVQVLQVATGIVNQAEILARSNLQQIEQVVKYVSQMPGQRVVILVSPGFLTQGDQLSLDRLIDNALRSQVVISSLDPKGLALGMRESDASQKYLPSGGVLSAARRLDSTRELVATGILSEVAEGTGGEFFHDRNDLNAGFSALAGSSVYYMLAFAPSEVKLNGKFHALKVTLNEKHSGFSIQARRGYFAPTKEAVAEAEAKDREAAEAEAHFEKQMQDAMASGLDVPTYPTYASLLEPEIDRAPETLRVIKTSATVERIDPKKRKITILLQNGKDETLRMEEGIPNLDEVKPGEQLTVGFTEAIVMRIDKKNEADKASSSAGLIAEGVAPETEPLDSSVVSAKILAIDAVDRLVSLDTEPSGENKTLRLSNTVKNLDELRVGETVEALVIAPRVVEFVPAAKTGRGSAAKEVTLHWDPPMVDSPLATLSSTPACSLASVLKLASHRAEELVEDLQRFDAHEQVHFELTDALGVSQSSIQAKFDYLVDFRRQPNELGLHEIRAPLAGTDPRLTGMVADIGVPALALIFYPALQSDYEMRCEGITRWKNKPAWVIYFRQIKGKRARTAGIRTASKVMPVSLKGRAWILADSGEVMHVETNLVEGVAVIEVQKDLPVVVQASAISVDYAPVNFPSKHLQLWLPQSAVSYTDYGKRRMTIRHVFSDFQLASVQTEQTVRNPKEP